MNQNSSVLVSSRVDHWDHEVEMMVVVTNYALYVIRFNFISLEVMFHQRIPLSLIKKVTIGDLSYPCRTIAP